MWLGLTDRGRSRTSQPAGPLQTITLNNAYHSRSGLTMKLYDSDVRGPNPFSVRLFIHERSGLALESQVIALSTLENRRLPYRSTVNPRGELPALRLDDGRVLTEITAICEYLDEVATAGPSLIGATPEERAFTRSWTRWADAEIAQGVVNWWRGSADAENFYRGNRVIFREGRHEMRLMAERGLNALDDHLDEKNFLCNEERPMLADILLFGFLFTMAGSVAWANNPGRTGVSRWFDRMAARPSCEAAMPPIGATI